MNKRIVICCDGTWNEPESVKDERKVPTNVIKMVRAVAARDERSGTDQIIYYDQGVGTGAVGVLDRHIGGGTGYGISKNIRDCYNFIANNYVAGDDIFFFGFSRGAYTVRSLGGMLAAVGLLSKNDLRYVPEAYAYYHVEPDKRAQSDFHGLISQLPRSDVAIKFIGVWDTVGALGIPTPVLSRVQQWAGDRWERFRVGFHDCSLSDIVQNAYQALAIDERRGPFKPSIWDKAPKETHVLQTWFTGVHSNIGGGYPDAGLSDTALLWIVNRARECGLDISDDYMSDRVESNPLGKLEDSYSTGYKVLEFLRVKPHVRAIGEHLAVDDPGRAQGRVTGERHLLRRGEDTHPERALFLPRSENERGLGEVHLASDRLHRVTVQSGGLGDHGKLVARVLALGEDVDDVKLAPAHVAFISVNRSSRSGSPAMSRKTRAPAAANSVSLPRPA